MKYRVKIVDEAGTEHLEAGLESPSGREPSPEDMAAMLMVVAHTIDPRAIEVAFLATRTDRMPAL